MDRNDRMDETTLHAYVDGQLTVAEAAQVAQWLQEHPSDATRVLSWQAQRSALGALHADLLDAPVPEPLAQALLRPPPRWPRALAAGIALVIGVVGGWAARSVWPGLDASQATAGAASIAATSASVPGFVRDATVAHVLYVPERRHPVEVGADQQDHLVQWLSRRLGTTLKAPVLDSSGYTLVGGRLLPAGEAGLAARPGSANALPAGAARAQFMYESAAGQRLTLYVSVLAPGPSAATAPAAFQFVTSGEGANAQQTFYWLEGNLGYALTGPIGREPLAALASLVYRQLVR
jgi:anti-sigma factor RsiW